MQTAQQKLAKYKKIETIGNGFSSKVYRVREVKTGNVNLLGVRNEKD